MISNNLCFKYFQMFQIIQENTREETVLLLPGRRKGAFLNTSSHCPDSRPESRVHDYDLKCRRCKVEKRVCTIHMETLESAVEQKVKGQWQ